MQAMLMRDTDQGKRLSKLNYESIAVSYHNGIRCHSMHSIGMAIVRRAMPIQSVYRHD